MSDDDPDPPEQLLKPVPPSVPVRGVEPPPFDRMPMGNPKGNPMGRFSLDLPPARVHGAGARQRLAIALGIVVVIAIGLAVWFLRGR